MSLQTWRDEYYPKSADHACETALEAAEHSLQKWKGLREDVLNEHGLIKRKQKIVEAVGEFEDEFLINDDTCSLCQYSYALCHGTKMNNCFTNCPLGLLLESEEDLDDDDEGLDSDMACGNEYHSWLLWNDPEPMIGAIERTIEMLRNKECKEFPINDL